MTESLDTGALLTRTYELPAGPRVRLRYARRSDVPGLRALLQQHGIEPTELELSRLVRYDPQRRAVICATAPIDGTELIVGVGAIALEEQAPPETLVVDEALTDGLADLLAAALVGRARAHARRVA
jgi:N-acetylglutamate synthase-like GNAT family acetyltransferase